MVADALISCDIKPSAIGYLGQIQLVMYDECQSTRSELTRIFDDATVLSGQHCTLRRLILALKVIANFFHFYPFDSWLGTDILLCAMAELALPFRHMHQTSKNAKH